MSYHWHLNKGVAWCPCDEDQEAPGFAEERIVEEVARAIYGTDCDGFAFPWENVHPIGQADYRRLAVAAVAAYRATQDGGAEAAEVDWFRLPDPEPTGPLTGGLITPENPVGGLRPANRGAMDVDALDAARAAATRGWNVVGGTHAQVVVNDAGENVCGTAREADAALIVVAVNALPDLLAEVRRGRALREAAEGLADEIERPNPMLAGAYREGWGNACEATAARLRATLAAVDQS